MRIVDVVDGGRDPWMACWMDEWTSPHLYPSILHYYHPGVGLNKRAII